MGVEPRRILNPRVQTENGTPTPVTNELTDPDGEGGNGAGLGRIRCCNRAASEAGHTRTEQESNGARNARNRLDKLDFRQGSTYPESLDLSYKEGSLVQIQHRLLRESTALQPVLNAGPEGHPLSNAHCCQARTTSVGSHIWKD